MRNIGVCIFIFILLPSCRSNSDSGEIYQAIVEGEVYYDYGKPISNERILLTSHKNNCRTEGVLHPEILLGALGKFRANLISSEKDQIRCLKFHRADTTVEVKTSLSLKKSKPFEEVTVTATFIGNEDPIKVINKTDHAMIVDIGWSNVNHDINPENKIPLEETSLPVLKPDESYAKPKNEILGTYEEEVIDFFIYEVVGDTAYYRDEIANSMYHQFYIYYKLMDEETEERAYYADITCKGMCEN
ncbi:hypothetical protein NC796_19200 [Aliifodinibius sp. S!AR15-10]|uniref:hypothetical protein n=1 Tax=Aliifodinibius sp. S!AR15-10 TaxID=2950437 RepID=UPI00285D1282|nr:hypothetical protein [Aliifodinibius sp. S!AR15-10]MDR8393290.1 hypothetical protein [Aliifodinibius sp. S!AR15-10]